MGQSFTSVLVAEGSKGVDPIAIGSLVVALAALAWTAYWNRRSERRGYLDEFWFRQVVAPKCVDPVLKLNDTWSERIESLGPEHVNQSAIQAFISDFQNDKAKVVSSLWIARIFRSGFYTKCSNHLDGVEDVIVDNLGDVLDAKQSLNQAKSVMRVALGDIAVEILSEAAAMHGGELKPRKGREHGGRRYMKRFGQWLVDRAG